eukprot:g5069.t1
MVRSTMRWTTISCWLESSRLVAVGGGRDHLVAVTDAGTAISWGRSNEFGQVGHGACALARAKPGAVRGLPALYRVCAVACGEYNTVLLLSSGELYAWGANDLGQLGTGDTEPRPLPSKISGSVSGVPFRAISAGFQHCLAVSRGGAVYTWGNRRHGRLGLGDEGSTPFEASPKLVPSIPSAKHVSGGGAACGDNRVGQLGLPRAQLEQATLFQEVTQLSCCGVRLVECGSKHTLCLTFDGLVVGFGANSGGQLGLGRTSDAEDTPMAVQLDAKSKKLLVFALARLFTGDFGYVLGDRDEADGLSRTVSLPSASGPTKRRLSQPIQTIKEEIETEDSNGIGLAVLWKFKDSYVKFKMPIEDSMRSEEVVQPGVASRCFSLLGPGDLLEMVRASCNTQNWRETAISLCAVLRCPSVLNASFHFQGMPSPHLDCEVLHRALELMEIAPLEVHDQVLEAAEAGLKEFRTAQLQSREQLRGLLIYLLLPQLRNPKFVQSHRHGILTQLVQLIASMRPAHRRLLLDLLVSELPQAFILKKQVVPAVRLFLNEKVRSLSSRHTLDDPGMWQGTMLMQLLFLANERLREEQKHELDLSNDQALKARFLGPEEFQISALDDATIPPAVAFQQLMQNTGMGTATWQFRRQKPICCVLLMHRNLVPVAFKQKVLQVSNSIMQRTLQDQAVGPHQLLAMLSGQDVRPFVMVEVSREHIVEDTARFLRQADAAALHLPLKEGQDEGGVRREFFQVLIRRLFDETLGRCSGRRGAPLALADQLKNCTAEINSTEGNKTFKDCREEALESMKRLRRWDHKSEFEAELTRVAAEAAREVISRCQEGATGDEAKAACLESTEARDLAARLSGGRAPAGDELREAVRDGAQRDMAETVQLCRTNAQDDQAKQDCLNSDSFKDQVAESRGKARGEVKDSEVREFIEEGALQDVWSLMEACPEDKQSECLDTAKGMLADAMGVEKSEISEDRLQKALQEAMQKALGQRMRACVQAAEDDSAREQCKTVLVDEALNRTGQANPERGEREMALKDAGRNAAEEVARDCTGERDSCMQRLRERAAESMGRKPEEMGEMELERLNLEGAKDAAKDPFLGTRRDAARSCASARASDPSATCQDALSVFRQGRGKNMDESEERRDRKEAKKKRAKDEAAVDAVGEMFQACMEGASSDEHKKDCREKMEGRKDMAGLQEDAPRSKGPGGSWRFRA